MRRSPALVVALAGLCVSCGGPPAPRFPVEPRAFDYDARAPLDVRIRGRTSLGGVETSDLDMASPAGGRVPALLYEPAEGAARPGIEPLPALIMLHGVPGNRASLAALARSYARAGVRVLSIAAPSARDLPYREWSMVPSPLMNDYDRTEVLQLVQDLRRAVDYLEGEAPGAPIGFVGHSAGAMIGGVLAAVEPRIAAFVLMAPAPGWASVVRYNVERGNLLITSRYDDLSPAERDRWYARLTPLESTRWIGRAGSTPILIQGGTEDHVVPPPYVRELYDAAAEGAEIRWYEAEHPLGPEAYADGARFLAPILGFDAAGFEAPRTLSGLGDGS